MQGNAARRAAQSGPRGVQINGWSRTQNMQTRPTSRGAPSDDFRVGTMRRVFLLRDEWGNERDDCRTWHVLFALLCLFTLNGITLDARPPKEQK